MKRTKVYIITECPYVGVYLAIKSVGILFKELGFDVEFILPIVSRDRYGETQAENEIGLKEIGNINHLSLSRSVKFLYRDFNSLIKFFKNKNNYIVISYTNYAGFLCRFLRIFGFLKLLYHAPQCIEVKRKKGYLKIKEYFLEIVLASGADKYLACSPSEASELTNHYFISKDKIILIPNFTNFKRTNSFSAPQKYRFVYVGRLVKDKGIYGLFDCLTLAGMAGHLTVVGDGPEFKNALIKYPDIDFKGRVTHNEVKNILMNSQFYLTNSIIEGLPFSLIEAMSLGVVPIASNVPGHFDIIDNYYNGYLFDDDSDLLCRLFKIEVLSKEEYLRLSGNTIFTATQLKGVAKKNLIKEFSTYE